jgi:hypothetical protein
LLTATGDVVHILHVIAPSRRLVVTPDMGLEGVIEDDEETKRKVVSSCSSNAAGIAHSRYISCSVRAMRATAAADKYCIRS